MLSCHFVKKGLNTVPEDDCGIAGSGARKDTRPLWRLCYRKCVAEIDGYLGGTGVGAAVKGIEEQSSRGLFVFS